MDAQWERAAVDGDVAAIRTMLNVGAAIDARDRYGQTALMLAAHRGHDALVQVLIDHGADLNVTAKYHLSALMLAVIAGHAPIVRSLAQAGADLSLRGSGAPGFAGKSAYDLALARGMTELLDALRGDEA